MSNIISFPMPSTLPASDFCPLATFQSSGETSFTISVRLCWEFKTMTKQATCEVPFDPGKEYFSVDDPLLIVEMLFEFMRQTGFMNLNLSHKGSSLTLAHPNLPILGFTTIYTIRREDVLEGLRPKTWSKINDYLMKIGGPFSCTPPRL